jgi:hypothetical protein
MDKIWKRNKIVYTALESRVCYTHNEDLRFRDRRLRSRVILRVRCLKQKGCNIVDLSLLIV